jgi:hypothetical protein
VTNTAFDWWFLSEGSTQEYEWGSDEAHVATVQTEDIRAVFQTIRQVDGPLIMAIIGRPNGGIPLVNQLIAHVQQFPFDGSVESFV